MRGGKAWAGAALAAALVLAACATPNPRYDPAQAHHTPEGFRNPDGAHNPGFARFLSWQWHRLWDEETPQRAERVPRLPVSAADLARPEEGWRVTWIGHATLLVQVDGVNILTDPIFSGRASPVSWYGPKRAVPPALQPAELPPIDAVVVSHNHYDHLDEASVRALQAQAGGPPLFIAPLGVGAWLRDQGMTRVVELDWWQSHTDAGLEVVLTPAQHWSGRGLHDRLATLWGGFAVFARDFHFFYSGDTGYSRDFGDIAARFADRQRGGGFDIALLPVGAYEPRWFMADQHVNPAEAVQIHRDLRARRSVGVHWGTFELTDEPLDTPPVALAAARRAQGVADDAFFVLAVGQTRRLPRRSP